MSAPQLKQDFKFKVEFQRGTLSGQSMIFDKPVVQIGRGTENDLILLNDLRASRHHAEIRWDGTDLHISNVSSKNFLAVNGNQVQSAKLESGAFVIVGESEFRIEFENPNAEPKTKVVHEPTETMAVQMPVLQQARPAPVQAPRPPPAVPPAAQIQYGARPNTPPRAARVPQAAGSNSRARFYGIILVVGVIFVWLMTSNNAKKKELTFRSTEQIEKDIEASREELKEFEARKEKLDNIQYKRAQENYIRGFRDYKQGNYGRARESFQVVLNLDPDNELAKRYYQLARLKFDEMVKFHMLQGNRYREKKNWRMCKSSYFNVMTMVANNQDPVFKEAKQYYDQCSLAQEGRY